jgi:hypothetical protein
MLKRSKKLVQAYNQAPWRRQMQILGLFAAGILGLALVAALYLEVTARAATAGRLVQSLQEQRSDAEQRIEDLETNLALSTSIEVMQERAEDLGFAPVSPAVFSYLPVVGYEGKQVPQLAPRAGSDFVARSRLPAEYTRSLFDWLGEMIASLGGL